MSRAIVAIVGRANVGKSTLFNRMVGKRQAVIEDYPGITRDRLYGKASWKGKSFLVADTGGFLHEPDEDIYKEVKKQVMLSVEEADIIILLMDAESGVLPLDVELINYLRKQDKKIFYAVNKIDGSSKEKKLYDFYSLGVDLFPVSAFNGYGFEELMERILPLLPEAETEDSGHPKIAIVGRPNVGKSTLVNALLSKDRMIVSPIAGTTRDAVDSLCSYYKKKYILVDTAGIRKKGKMSETIERYSYLRTLRNLEDCHVALIILDASHGVVELDQRIAGLAHEAKKGSLILLNKWDLVDKNSVSLEAMVSQVREKLWFMRYAPVLTISAVSKQRVTNLFPLVDKIISESSKRISTAELNAFLRDILALKEPPIFRNRRVKIYYITQAGIYPPRFVVFTNRKEGIKEQYIRFLEKKLREKFSFEGVPLEFYIRQRESK
jgi:GTP-binding protein